jgi:hypothetical protein
MFGALTRSSIRAIERRSSARSVAEEGRESEALVRGLADRLYRQALAGGGWAADIGALGPRVFERDARGLVAEVALGCAQGGPPSP